MVLGSPATPFPSVHGAGTTADGTGPGCSRIGPGAAAGTRGAVHAGAGLSVAGHVGADIDVGQRRGPSPSPDGVGCWPVPALPCGLSGGSTAQL